MHFIEDGARSSVQGVAHTLHTSKRMHFIEDTKMEAGGVYADDLHTSKRMHFIEEWQTGRLADSA